MYVGNLSPVSNQEDWKIILEIDDDDTGLPIDLTGATIVFEVRDPRNRNIILSGATGNGIVTILDIGVFQVLFVRTSMNALPAQNYDLGCILTINGETRQYIVGTVPVLDGVVTQ